MSSAPTNSSPTNEPNPQNPRGGSESAGVRSLGIAGSLTRAFITSPLTPLLLIAALALGLIALVTLPR